MQGFDVLTWRLDRSDSLDKLDSCSHALRVTVGERHRAGAFFASTHRCATSTIRRSCSYLWPNVCYPKLVAGAGARATPLLWSSFEQYIKPKKQAPLGLMSAPPSEPPRPEYGTFVRVRRDVAARTATEYCFEMLCGELLPGLEPQQELLMYHLNSVSFSGSL